MSSKYEKSYVHEEEGTYHRREIEPIAPSRDEKNYTTHHESSYQIVPKSPAVNKSAIATRRTIDTSDDDENNYEEWTTSKRKINHKTRQVETRVSRQLLVEDGKVIADSGPQVTTRIKEDNKVEECEKEKAPKNKSKFDAIACAPEGESSGRVLGEKKEIQRVSREVREENMQYHDERFKELTGHDVHRRAIQAPHELITITDKSHHASSAPRGKMVHYSNKAKKYQDTDEILEVAKLAIDGSITKEVKRTRHHEECSEDELPDEKGEAEALREEPIATRSSRRHVDYVNDFDDTATPSCSSDDEVEAGPIRRHKAGKQASWTGKHHHGGSKTEEAFPRYEIDPLLNSLRDEDFKPISHSDRHSSSGSARHKQVPMARRDKVDSSDYETGGYEARAGHRQRSPSPQRSERVVEIPEEYRVNKQRLMSQRERSFSPATNAKSATRKSGSARHHRQHRDQDASVQAHLSDEEVERTSMHSDRSSLNSHAKQTRHLQRQSTANSSRNYYYGKPKHQHRQRAPSVSSTSSSSSSSSIGNQKDKQRKKGVKSRDSGFRSPHRPGSETPLSNSPGQQIYSVSNKASKRQQRPLSPTGSLGQRSVKTTTTTVSAGLKDRPRSRQERTKSPSGSEKTLTKQQTNEDNRSIDTVSLASLGATKICVPYRDDITMDHERDTERPEGESASNRQGISKPKQQHFNYRTIIANVQPLPIVPRQQLVDSYNVRVIQHNSPFLDQIQPIESMRDLSSSIARLEQLSSNLSSISAANQSMPSAHNNQATEQLMNNNNEANFNLDHFMKQKHPVPFETFSSKNKNERDNEDNESTSSLRSSRTYHIRCQDSTSKGNQRLELEDDLDDASHFPVKSIESIAKDDRSEEEMNDDDDGKGDETDGEKKPRAWVFDLRDNSSTAITAPVRPKDPEVPKVDAKTEELARSKGGRSYYLELIEREPKKKVNENLYTRWSSQNALNLGRQVSGSNYELNMRKSRQSMLTKPNVSADERQQQGTRSSSVTSPLNRARNGDDESGKPGDPRRQLPFSGLPLPAQLASRSKSVSCLANSTRPSKYSIYGGFKRPNEDKKPVPRLSYSRAIGPKSQRKIDNRPKTPSRYLKMK